MEDSENYSHPEDCGSDVQLIVLVDEVVAGQILKEEFENDSCPYDSGSNVQLIVMVGEVFDGQVLVEEFDLAFHPRHREGCSS